jgi:phosphoribosylanthranilate isomerase
MFVKICGITRRDDALAAVECGASAIGFVFWPDSPRFVDPAVARAISEALPPSVQAVGVFVNQHVDEINVIADRVQLSAVQLHGNEDEPFSRQVRRSVIKAVTLADGAGAVETWSEQTILLVDAHDPIRRGGTGQLADWSAAAELAAKRRILLAGGITPENVAEAVARVRPYGIDVSSGVEATPGVKDHDRLKALFRALEN